ncbi:MAG TPA: hypothetical protein VIT38_09540 [Allosphingosinicella sp.]|jgi:hypothetical protein
MTTTTQGKKVRLRLVLAIAASLGCSSATLSGALSALAIQQSPHGQTQRA